MARQESDREDLLREATALTACAEVQLTQLDQSSFVGFRRNGCFSFYRKNDEVYHFNSAGELRRAHIADELIKAESGKLVGLTRRRESGQVALIRRVLTAPETHELISRLETSLAELQRELANQTAKIVGIVDSVEMRAIAAVQRWLENRRGISIADSPNVS